MVQRLLTVMLIANKLAIDMEWNIPFDYGSILRKIFYLDNGQEMKAETMIKKEEKFEMYNFYKDDNIIVLTMDLTNYYGTQYEFMAIMPKKKNLNVFIENVSEEQVNQINKKLKLASDERGGINIEIPKFKFNYDLKLKQDLIDLGIKYAFDLKNADFSNILNLNDIFIADALHRADIAFKEDGVKVAALTIMEVMNLSTEPDEEAILVDIIINKLFMFIIRDKNTKDIWFTGRVYETNLW